MGRKTACFQTLNDGSRDKIAAYSYDAVGRLVQKRIYPERTYQRFGSTPEYIYRPPSPTSNGSGQPIQDIATKAVVLQPNSTIDANVVGTYLARIGTGSSLGTVQGLQTIDYNYHIRGMVNCVNCSSNTPTLTPSQNDLFANKLEFETGTPAAANYFDGNIGKQTWLNKKDNQPRSYVYTYDAASRLKSATYAGTNAENYSLSNINYDANGNILSLLRKGKNGSSFGDIDNLSYAYNGNRLQAVSDAVNGNENANDFRDVSGSLDYTYWNDGSLKSDANRGIALIEYDSYLQRVKQVNFNNGNGSVPRWLKFYYDGKGELLRRENAQNEVWEYSNGIIYKSVGNGQPQLYQIATSEGRIIPKAEGGFENEFEYRDVWGNLRLSYKAGDGSPTNGVYAAPIITQTDDFDMLGFGLSTAQNGGNNFRFQKQERVFDYGLNWDLFKFRYSDSQIGRFHQTDPLSADFPYNSTYALQENKFGMGIELEGKELENFFSQFKKPSELKEKLPEPSKSQNQSYSVSVSNPKISFSEMKQTFLTIPEKLLSNSKAEFHAPENAKGEQTGLQKGNTIEIEIAGPQNDSYVKVRNVSNTKDRVSATFVTLEGHVEKGVINFSIQDKGKYGMNFTISSTSQLDYGAANAINKLGEFSRNSQKESWKEVLINFVNTTGGKEENRIIK